MSDLQLRNDTDDVVEMAEEPEELPLSASAGQEKIRKLQEYAPDLLERKGRLKRNRIQCDAEELERRGRSQGLLL